MALVLSSLALTPDQALKTFRDRRVGDSELDLIHLEHARGILDAVGQAITRGDVGRWRRLEAAFGALKKDAVLVLDDDDEEEAVEPVAAMSTGKDTAGSSKALPSSKPEAPAVGPAVEPATAAAAPIAAPPAAPPIARPVAAPPQGATAPSGGPSPWAKSGADEQAGPPAPVVAPIVGDLSTPFRAGPVAKPASAVEEQPHEHVGETAFVQALVIDDDEVLPFNTPPQHSAAAQAAASPELPFKGKPQGAPPPVAAQEPHDAVGETGFMESPLIDAPLPFQQGAAPATSLPPRLAALTLQQYASFCVEQRTSPAQIDAIRARYNVADAAQHAALDDHWKRQLSSDGAMQAEFEQHCSAFQEWLSQQSRS